jgi:predicted dehydrogenase
MLAPYYVVPKQVADSGILGDIKQVSVHFNGLARRWDWQTMQRRLGGSVYNTGPHPIGFALGFLGFSDDVRVAYSKLDLAMTSGDAEDYAKIILTAPGMPVVDIEISSMDAYSSYNIKLQGTRGTMEANASGYKMKYYTDEENPAQPLQPETLRNKEGLPLFCSEKLISHEKEEKFHGTSFDVAVKDFYRMVYNKLKQGTAMAVTPEMAAKVINVIETVHGQNPLPVLY